MQIVLEVIEGPHRGQRFTFDGHDNFIVGRGRCAHFRLPKRDPYFSRVHFMIEINPPYCLLMDMGSTNGTRVNGRRVKAAYLGHGDLIQGGDTVVRVSLVGEADEAIGELACAPPPPAAWMNAAMAEGPEPEAAQAAPPEMSISPPPVPRPSSAEAAPTQKHQAPEATESFRRVSPEVLTGPPSVVPVSAEEAPMIPGYQVRGKVGHGGMGVVYLATRLSDGVQVALKTIALATAARQREIQRFLREANILRQLRHPNIVAFHEMDRQEDLLYFVMDYVPGTDASTLLAREGPLAIGRAVRLLCQALEALDYAHRQGFVHRDVKPANLLVTQGEGGETCKLADFGLARVYQASTLSGITMLGDTGGTLPYMPPEQITHYRDATPAADQYSAAASLYRLLTGQLPYDFGKLSNPLRVAKILSEEPVPIQTYRPDVAHALAEAVHRGLAKKPTARFSDAGAFREALLPFSGDA